jgi:hypothetical protein
MENAMSAGYATARQGRSQGDHGSRRLRRHLRRAKVVALHDLRISGTGLCIDHVCVGPGGVTVIDSTNLSGKVIVRDGDLLVEGHRQTKLVDGLTRQREMVRMVLAAGGVRDVPIAAALSMPNADALPILGRFELNGVLIDGPRGVAKLAKRPPEGDPVEVDDVADLILSRLIR